MAQTQKETDDFLLCGEDLLVSRSIGKLEGGRYALMTLRKELTALKNKGRKPKAGKLEILIGLTNTSLTALNDLSWRLQLRKRGGESKMVGSMGLLETDALKNSAGKAELDDLTLRELNQETLIAKYNELSLRRRILAEEFNKISDHAIALQRSRLYKFGSKFSNRSAERIDKMVDIACAIDVEDGTNQVQ